METGRPVECCLHTVSLNDDPTFVALSYVWGDPAQLDDIVVNGHAEPIAINLEAAFRYVKPHGKSLEPNEKFLLWSDAVCINRDDIAERTSQIQLMGSIYRNCRVAFAWLGQHDEDTKDAFECARYIHEHVPGEQQDPPYSWPESAPISLMDARCCLGSLV